MRHLSTRFPAWLLGLVLSLGLSCALARPVAAQACFFADNYSNPTRWTQLGTGISVGSDGVQVTNTSGGGGFLGAVAQRGVYQSLSQPLPDGGGWRLDLKMDYRTVGSSGGLLVVAVAAGTQHPLNIFPGGTMTITPQDCIGIITTGSLGARPVPLSLFVSDNGNWSQSRPLNLQLNAVTYLRLERLNAGMLRLSAFQDSARTQHQPGSPVCYVPPGQYTNLGTVWHANLPQGSDLRNDNATLDDLCLSTIPVLDTALTAAASRVRLCPGEALTLTAPNPDYAPVRWTATAPDGSVWTDSGARVTYAPLLPGTYTVQATGTLTRFCDRRSTERLTVEVVAPDPTALAYDQPRYCRTGQTPVPTFGPPGGVFSGSAGLVVNPQTGVIDLAASAPGAHSVTYTSAGFCPRAASDSLFITPLDATSLAYTAAAWCRRGLSAAPLVSPVGGIFSGTPGLILNTQTGVIDLGASTAGAHLVTYTSAGQCPTTATFPLVVNPVPVAALTYPMAVYCPEGQSAPPAVSPAGGRFRGAAGLVLNPQNGVIDLATSAPGTYTITYVSSGSCPDSAAFAVTIRPANVATVVYANGPAFCQRDVSAPPLISLPGGRFSGTAGLSVNPLTGVLNLAASALGPHVVTYLPPGPCPVSTTAALTVTPVAVAALAYASASFCRNGTASPLTATPPGGTFGGAAGVIVDPSTGVVDLAASALGPHTVTYTSAGACPTTATAALTITPRPLASVTYAEPSYCSVGRTAAPMVAPAGGGQFTGGDGVVVDSTTGIVDLGASAPGAHAITFTSADACVMPVTVAVTIRPALQPVFPNIITPNGDGTNEAFGLASGLPPGTPLDVQEFELLIFSRWGRQVWRTTDVTTPWSASEVSSGVYYYSLRLRDCAGRAQSHHGWLEVVK